MHSHLAVLKSIAFLYPSEEPGATMTSGRNPATGIELLIQKYRKEFEIPENLDYYSAEDYSAAQKKYLKWCLLEGRHGNPGKPVYLEG